MNGVVSQERVNRLNGIRDKLELSYENIDVKPVTFCDWSGTFGERWETIPPDFSDVKSAKKFLDYQGYDYYARDESETDEEYERRLTEQAEDAWQDSECGIPMMNYYYPIELRHEADVQQLQMKMFIDGGATALVEFEGKPVIVLTGGGMDLSWDICLAYILCDSYPPVHFCDLPQFAGQSDSDKNLTIIAACQKSCQGLKERAERAASRLDNVLAALTEYKK